MTNQADHSADDFGVLAWREEGLWRASRLTITRDLGSIMDQLKAQQGDSGSVALGGDIDLLSDFGINAMDLEIMSDDLEMYPEEQITSLAHRLGFGEQFDQLYDRD